jgi:DNA-binding beta-propeller fold protein YncE|tara:strand:- start:207 stop:1079 length:873 start_codon:yes stop_codon:yes gene_type:complete
MVRLSQGCVIILLATFSIVNAWAFEVGGMKTPNSFIVDPSTGNYFVSNINGHPLKKDNNGFISKIDSQGKLIDLHFIQGGKNRIYLNAPKGLVLFGNNLYVADIDTIRQFDTTTGKLLGSVDFSLLGAKLLSSLATDHKYRIYISDTLGNFIFWMEPTHNNRVGILAKGPALGQPNGLVYDLPNKRLLVATWKTGKILFVNLNGQVLPLFRQKGLKNLYGLDLDQEGNIIFSSFSGGKIFRVKNYQTMEIIREGLNTPADISVDKAKNKILTPSFEGNRIQSFPIPASKN